MSVATDRIEGFRERFSGEVVTPGDRGYEDARRVWNATIDRRPALVVRPNDVDGVIAAVRFARENDLLVAVRGGGHSMAGLSTCDGGIVIDLSRMRGARVDPTERVARVNGGALLGELDEAAQAHGLVCPVGVVSHTGVAGLTLGGGMGKLQRSHGLTIDSLRAVDLITADGEPVRASERENADLFWGLRGAGANFGIATAFEFDLHPLAGPVTQGIVLHPIERAHEVAGMFRYLADTAPDEMLVSLALTRALPPEDFDPAVAGKPVVALSIMHSGTPDAAERDLREVRGFSTPLMDTVSTKTYLEVQHMADEAMAWGKRFYMKSLFAEAPPDAGIDALVEEIERAPAGVGGSFSFWPWGRAISRVGEDDTAFSGRNASFWAASESLWDEPGLDDAGIEWGRRAGDRLLPYSQGARYVNDVGETTGDVVRSVYGDAKYRRLQELKSRWDPHNVFRLNQNIPPAGAPEPGVTSTPTATSSRDRTNP